MRDINKTDYVFKHRVLWFDIGWLCEKIANSKYRIKMENDLYSPDFIHCLPVDVADLKHESLARRYPKENPLYRCFMCEYAHKIKSMKYRYECFSSDSECAYCPLITKEQFKNGCLNGYFSLFMELLECEHDYKKAAEIAYKIASMPVIN